MKIINNNIPDAVYQWLVQDLYDSEAAKGTISATSLKKPTQEYILTQRHWDEIEVDATDRLWSLFGSGVHAVLDKVEGQTEERLYAEVAGRKISGKFDRIDNGELRDFKVTSAYTIVYGSREDDWRHQLSIYRYLYYVTYKMELKAEGKIIAILRDWDRKSADRGGKYPQQPIIEIPITLYTIPDTLSIIEHKVSEIKTAEGLADDKLPECSDEERWWNDKKQEYAKCAKYCNAYKFCHQIKRAQEAGNK